MLYKGNAKEKFIKRGKKFINNTVRATKTFKQATVREGQAHQKRSPKKGQIKTE